MCGGEGGVNYLCQRQRTKTHERELMKNGACVYYYDVEKN